jgi:uncharacterized membrane protein YfcA
MLSSLTVHIHYAWLVIASFLAGVMNAMAGGGSFVSFPAMLAMGVAPIQANATNTVALWPGQLTSVAALRSDLRRDLLPVVIASSVLGGVSGAVVLLKTKQITFLHMVPWLLLVASLLFGISGPVSRWLRQRAEAKARASMVAHDHDATPALVPLFLVLLPVCFYIGYFGAGAGFLIMSALALFGIEEMRALNSMKVLAACLSNLCAVITFIVSGAVIWKYCLISMVICGVGGWIGAQYARKMNPDVLRLIVVATGCVMAAYFFWAEA